MPTAVFHLGAGPLCSKLTFKSHKNRTMNDVMLCPAVCVSDVINLANMCGKSVRYVTSQRFGAIHW